MELSTATALALALTGAGAGLLGALVGVGGGVVLVPALLVLFHFDVQIAVATSLVAVIATSTAAGSVYVGQGQTNMRLGMTLEIATTLGGITGGLIAVNISQNVLAVVLVVVLLISAALLTRSRPARETIESEGNGTPSSGYETPGRLAGAYVDDHLGRTVPYEAKRLPLGSSLSYLAGAVSGMLGVGGGFLKVPAMNLGMDVPMKVAAATSNFMIGVTALSSLTIYAARGYVHPYAAGVVAVGVVGGALVGTRVQRRAAPRLLRIILAVVLVGVSVQLLADVARGGLGG